MDKVVENIYDLIGETPLLRVKRLEKKYGLSTEIYAKLEYLNPAGSIKDRVAYNMVRAAEEKGLLKAGSVIIEPTSGNTGIGLACIAAAKGYRAVFTMPDTMSVERRRLLQAYGAEIVLTPGAQGMKGAILKAEALGVEIPGAFIPAQFDNPANPEAHINSTGPEIWEQTGGRVDALVASVGTGGTITGTGAYLKVKNPGIQVIAVEPKGSPVLSGGKAGPHKIQGIGAGFVPKVLDTRLYDAVVAVSDEDAMRMGREMARTEGALVGISSGAALWAAVEAAKSGEYRQIVVILPDTGERYLSSELFE